MVVKKVACRNGVHEYFVVPGSISGFTYTWTVTGGNIINATGTNLSNPLTTVQNYIRVKWGNTSDGLLTVYITNPDGSCRDTLIERFCLVVGPNSNFSIDNPGTVCKNSPVSFTNNSTGGTEYFWDFGDGTYSNLQNPPPHSYSLPGIKIISLTVSKKCSTEYDGPYPIPQSNKFPCTSISYQTITVSDKEGLKIITDCNQMICVGEKVRYCAEGNCSSLNWQVVGGTIVGGPANSKKSCIEVIWDSPPATGLPTITLTGNCGGGCGNTATLEVPVLYNNIPVTGNNKVCKTSQETYSLPVMAGTFYNWTITPFIPITGNSINTNSINVDWSSAIEGNSYTIKCDYYNPMSGPSNSKCSGSTTLVVEVKPKLQINGLTKFCTLTNQTFSLAPTTSSPLATWSILPATGFAPPLPGTNVASITENWSVAGTYQITAVLAPASLPNFCTPTADIIVQVNPQPTVTINPANPVCPGTPTMYSAVPSIPGGTFNWSLGGGGTISTNYGDSILVVWTANTAHTISLTYTLNGCVATNTLNIPILTNGTPSGLQTVCMDAIETYQITGGNIPAGSYNWSISSGAAGGTILNGQGTNQVQILWHGNTPIPNTRIETLSITTCAGVITWPVTVISSGTIIITVTGNLCTPAGATLTTNLPAGTVCNWYKNGVLIPGNGISLQIFSEGLYKVVPGGSAACFSPATINIPKEFNGVATIIANGPTTYDCVPFSLTINAFIDNIAATLTLYDFTWYSYTAPNTNIPVGTNSPVLTVTTPGIYWVKICMKGSQCCSNSNMIQVIQMGCPGPAGCTSNATGTITRSPCNPFNFSVTWNPGTVINTVWNFGDGSPSASGTSTSHNYEYAGSYWVTVSGCIPDGNGNCCAVFDKINYIVPFVPRFDTTYPACGSVKLINQTTFVPGPSLTYTWTSTGVSTHTTDALNNAIFTYTTSGNYVVTLTVSDGVCTQSYSLPVHVFIPTAVISGPDPVCAGSSASFFTTTPALPNNYQYFWEFGDTYTSLLSQTQHIYSNPSSYTVKVTVTDEYGCKATGTKNITVLPALVVNLSYTPDTLICPGSTVTFTTTTTNFQTYQWYQDDIAIPGANTNSYTTGVPGIYHVVVTGNNGICTAKSKIYHVFHKQKAVAVINTSSVACFNTSTNTATINLSANSTTFGPFTYKWKVLLKPSSSTVTIPNDNVQFATASVNLIGMYQFEVTVTNTNSLCTAKDSICVFVTNAPTVAITSSAGLCAGIDNLLQTTNYPPVDPTHSYVWSNGISGQMTNAFNSGIYTITKIDKSSGCFVKSNALTILPRPSTILFPAGCDTICMNDTSAIMPPLPLQQGQTIAGVYNVKWLDNGVPLLPQPLSPGVPLPISSLTLGMHHLTAIVSFTSGSNNCVDTSASYDVYIKDCIGDTCNKCDDILKSVSIDDNVSVTGSDDYQLNNSTITFTILKPVSEVRLSLDQLNYEWNDSTCYDCKLTPVERGCLFPANPNQSLGTLLWDNTTGSTIPPNATGPCTREIVWKNGTMLQPGTYTIPVQLSLPGSGKGKCKLTLKNYCVRLTLLDEDCNRCESTVCKDSDNDACNCNAGNTWTSLMLTPKKPGVPKTPGPVFCNTTITGVSSNTPYVLSGVYNCMGKCPSIKNEITVYDQQNQLIYTRLSTALNETLVFPAPGTYSITVTATCGTKKCACSFRVEVPDPVCLDCPIITDVDPPDYPIDSVLTDILPPDFNGEILVAKNDTVLYEKYISYKDSVNSHTAFDLASITKTFTSMAILKLMEDGKLNIDEAVSKYLLEFPIQEITIKMLMSHKSGLEDYLNFMDGSDWDRSKPMSNADLLQFIVNNKAKVLIGVPGKTFDYSNTNFALLSLIIEKISGQSYADYLTSVFFKPLQMNDTYVLGLENHARATKSYYKSGAVYKFRYLDMINGDKNVYSTVQDLRKWDKGLRNGKLFKKSTLDLAYGPSNLSVAYVSNYGLGWKKLVASNGNEVLYHTGWWAGSRSILIRLLKENVIIAVVSNNNFTNIAEIRRLVDLFGDFKLSNKKIPNF